MHVLVEGWPGQLVVAAVVVAVAAVVAWVVVGLSAVLFVVGNFRVFVVVVVVQEFLQD